MVRQGRKNFPHYRIVVSDKRSKLDGAYIENIGSYEPKATPDKKIVIKEDKLVDWLRKGALLSKALAAILTHAGKMPKLEK
jgi:small subunit ribosomal protein S16